MISTTIRRKLPSAAAKVLSSTRTYGGRSMPPSSSSATATTRPILSVAMTTTALDSAAAGYGPAVSSGNGYPARALSIRSFSSSSAATAAADNVELDKKIGRVTKTLRVLDMEVVKKITEELRSVDVDANGRLDTEELKELLRKHHGAFTEDEIVEIGELFYAGKSGGSVPFDRFVEAVDRVVQREQSDDYGEKDEQGNPLDVGSCGNEWLFYKSHGNYSPDDLKVKQTHREPKSFMDRLAFGCVKAVRFGFDKATGWDFGDLKISNIMNRVIYLETIAAVPGMVAAIVRHFKSLRTMRRDGGMMQLFLDEANNERMHLLTFVRMKDPSRLFRAMVILGQVGFGSAFFLSYIVSPAFCHRFVGYIEEEAVMTYTKIIDAVEKAPEGSELAAWRTQRAPAIARGYWHLGENGTVLDLMYVVRADEAEHRDVNHLCSGMKDGMQNPLSNTEQRLNTMLLKYVQDLMDRTPEGQDVVRARTP